MKQRSNFKICMRLIGLVKPLTGFMVLAVLLGILGHLCAAFIPVLGAFAFLNLLNSAAFGLTALFACLVVFAILRGALHYGEQACNHFIAFKLLALIRNKIFAALRKLCPAKLEGREKGNLISVITADIELLEVFYAHTISPIAIAALMSVIMSLFVGSYHWAFGLIAAVAFCTVGVAVPLAVSKSGGDVGRRFRTESGQLSSFVLDSLRGLRETLQYGNGAARLQALEDKTQSLSESEARMRRQSGQGTAWTGTVILMFDMLMLFTAALLYIHRLVDFAGVIVPVVALMSSFGPVIALANLGSGLQNTFAAGGRVLDILEEKPVTEEITGKTDCNFTGAEVKNVTFSYGGDTILDDICLKIPQNTVVGIVGKSGSGKSTLLKLLMRFWTAQQGSVEISSRSIEAINTENLRRMEGFVTQETHLFHDSIANNLRIAKPNATQEELELACKKAAVHNFIQKLPKGYDTPVGELGDTLSGGERQRIGLARAFLHDAPFLLLDEPTSNLDSLNEAVILHSIEQARADKTVVLVSHRASTMRLAHKVYSVEHGRMS